MKNDLNQIIYVLIIVISFIFRQIVHQKLKTHLCQFCSKGFYKESKLREHLRCVIIKNIIL